MKKGVGGAQAQLPTDTRRDLQMYDVIVNGINLSRNEGALDAVKKVFQRAGKPYTLHFTQYAGHAREIARQLTAGGRFAHLIAMGGDGTLHEIINGVDEIEHCTVGVIPIGTGNDFAATAGIPLDTKSAAELIAFRAPTRIDYIELSNGLRSVNAVGAGIDVDVLRRAYSGRRQGRSKYFSAFIKSVFGYKCTTFKVIYDGKEEIHTGLIAALGNGRQIGGGIELFPAAEIDDGYMDLMIVDYLSRPKMIGAFLKLVTGKVDAVREATYIKCKTASIIPVDGQSAIQAEGEIYENTELSAKIVSGKLKFYLPEHD